MNGDALAIWFCGLFLGWVIRSFVDWLANEERRS
jgi:hypothetical protein